MEKKKTSRPSTKQKRGERLVAMFPTTDPSTMEDFLLCVMATIEDGLMMAGAQPSVDYNFRDLLQAANPIVAHQWAEGRLSYVSSYPPGYPS